MEQKQNKQGLVSYVWIITLILGIAFSGGFILETIKSLATRPIDWELVLSTFSNVPLIVIPFGLVSWFLWTRRGKKMPSLAFIVTLLSGGFWLMFCIAEVIGGFTSGPIDWTEAGQGFAVMAGLLLPFIAVAWLLWFRPIFGGIALICQGIFLEVLFGFEIQDLMDPKNPTMAILVGLPIVLGIFTLVREILTKKGQLTLKNAD